MIWTLWIILGATLGVIAVGIDLWIPLQSERNHLLKRAVRHHIIHAVILTILGLVTTRLESPLLLVSGGCFTVGIFLFSGSIYLYQRLNRAWLLKAERLGSGVLLCGWLTFILGVAFY